MPLLQGYFRVALCWICIITIILAVASVLREVRRTDLELHHREAFEIASIPPGREDDYTDVFASFEGRRQCGFGALDLHQPVPNPCTSQQGLLEAMTSGARPGFNEPFEPQGCDLHFFRTPKICKILSRFEAVIIFGDSMMRHLEQAFAMLLRENYYDGAQAQWADWTREGGWIHHSGKECKCEEQAFSWNCIQGETDVQDIYKNSEALIKCPPEQRANIIFRHVLKWPLEQPAFDNLIAEVTSPTRPLKPYAFILGHAGWNDVNATATLSWVDQVLDRLGAVRPYLSQVGPFQYPRAFISITAAGPLKPSQFIGTQGNEAVPRFDAAVKEPILKRGIHFLGPYNMSRNARIPDGTHSGIRINLLKSMALVNWLAMADTRIWNDPAP